MAFKSLILGVDPGSIKTGYGIVDWADNQFHYIASGTIKMNSKQLLSDRLHIIYDGLGQIIERYQPQQFAIEEVYLVSNPRTALVLGHARGAAIVAAVKHKLPVAEYAARLVKKTVVGYGGASKQQMQFMVRKLLGVDQDLQEDAADALGVAICHGLKSRLL